MLPCGPGSLGCRAGREGQLCTKSDSGSRAAQPGLVSSPGEWEGGLTGWTSELHSSDQEMIPWGGGTVSSTLSALSSPGISTFQPWPPSLLDGASEKGTSSWHTEVFHNCTLLLAGGARTKHSLTESPRGKREVCVSMDKGLKSSGRSLHPEPHDTKAPAPKVPQDQMVICLFSHCSLQIINCSPNPFPEPGVSPVELEQPAMPSFLWPGCPTHCSQAPRASLNLTSR